MPRQSRLDAPGTLHHVIGRGIEGRKNFRSRGDREDFLDRLAKLCEAKAMSVYAWALLDTHFHLLVRSGNQSLSQSMRKLLTGYMVPGITMGDVIRGSFPFMLMDMVILAIYVAFPQLATWLPSMM